MIKINLLPVKQTKRREQGVRQLIVGAISFTVALVVVIVFHGTQASAISRMKDENAATSRAIAQLKADVGDYDQIKAQRDELIRQREAIKRLQANRSGPVGLMRELSELLTKGKGPTFNREQYEELIRKDPNAGINPNWEPRRVWLLNYEEKNHSVKIHGGAKSDEDVAEFLKRLKLSAYFSNVYWQQTQPAIDQKLNVSYVTFDVTCRVSY